MPTSLTLIPAGATISATTLRARLLELQHYVNEQVAASDRGNEWCTANHIYRPDFYGAPNPHTTMVSGENYFRERPVDPDYRTFFSFYMGEGPYLVPGLTATIQVPETLEQGTYYYRLNVFASFYAYEFGGNDGAMDEQTNLAATVHLGTTTSPIALRDRTNRPIYKGSQTYEQQNVVIFPRKQHSIQWAFPGNATGLTTPGVQSLGLWVKPFIPGTTSPAPTWKHIIFQQANLIARYRIR